MATTIACCSCVYLCEDESSSTGEKSTRSSLLQTFSMPRSIRRSCSSRTSPIKTASPRQVAVWLRLVAPHPPCCLQARAYHAFAVEVRAEDQHDEGEHLAQSTDPSQGRH